MLNLKVDKSNVELISDSGLYAFLDELITGTVIAFGKVSANAEMYTELRDIFTESVADVEYDTVMEVMKYERKSNDL